VQGLRPSFSEEKEAKRLLLIHTCAGVTAVAHAPNSQKFFASFFQKRSPSFPSY
jgi:hypothetical protein